MGSRTCGQVQHARRLAEPDHSAFRCPICTWKHPSRNLFSAGTSAPSLLCRGIQAPQTPGFLALCEWLRSHVVHPRFPFPQAGRTVADDIGGDDWALFLPLLSGMASRLANLSQLPAEY